jgi:hypothetical protein
LNASVELAISGRPVDQTISQAEPAAQRRGDNLDTPDEESKSELRPGQTAGML